MTNLSNITASAVAASSPFLAVPIRAFYPISGIYGHAPRLIYYALIIFSIITRHFKWLAFPALVAAMLYSGGAAVHSVILLAVKARGTFGDRQDISFDSDTDPYSLWPVVWDLDTDATFAILLFGYLCVIPIFTWSKVVKDSKQLPILILWTLLILVGLVCALVINNQMHYDWAPKSVQIQFCPLRSISSALENCAKLSNPNGMNQTIWSIFAKFDTCICPSLGAESRLRDADSIVLEEISPSNVFSYNLDSLLSSRFPDSQEGTLSYSSYNSMMQILVQLLVPFVTFYNIVIIINDTYKRPRSRSLRDLNLRFKTSCGLHPNQPLTFENLRRARRPTRPARDIYFSLSPCATDLFVFISMFYALVLSPIAIVLFSVWMELNLWHEPVAETFKNVGQWTSIILLALVLFAAVVAHYFGEDEASKKLIDEEHRGLLQEGQRENGDEDVQNNQSGTNEGQRDAREAHEVDDDTHGDISEQKRWNNPYLDLYGGGEGIQSPLTTEHHFE